MPMTIDFACTCGKQFRVAPEHAGKRTKCPACGNALTVPTAPEAPEPPADDEDAAFRALSAAPEPGPTDRSWREPIPAPPSAAPPPRSMPEPIAMTPPTPPKTKTKKVSAYYATPAPRERQWTVDWGKVGGGIFAVILGSALLFGGLAVNRFFIWSPIIIMGGLFSIINGLLTKE